MYPDCFRLLLLLSLMALLSGGQVYGQQNGDSTQHPPKVIHVDPPNVVNWQQAADSGSVKPGSPKYIKQIEDMDSTHRHTPYVIPAGTPTYDPAHLPAADQGAQGQTAPATRPRKHRCHKSAKAHTSDK